jgi:integrase
MEKSRLREAAPTSVNVTVGRRRREYLTEREVGIEAAKQNRSGHRDATAILVAYRHGFRASELVALRWDDIDLTTGRLHVRRAKGGDASVHPISARESRALPCFIIRDAKRAGARLRPFRGGAGTAEWRPYLAFSPKTTPVCGFT